ncbi:MAG: CHAT domain-containing tetratricopeptide repeat protein [Elainellaceae cyanobacterium]
MMNHSWLWVSSLSLLLAGIPSIVQLTVATPIEQDLSPHADRLLHQGVEFHQSGNLEQAITTLEAALTQYQTNGDLEQQLLTLVQLSAVYIDAGYAHQAIDTATAALQLAQQTHNQHQEFQSLGNLAIAHVNLGDYLTALDMNQQALALAQTLNNPQAEAQILGNTASVYEALGDYENALRVLHEGLAIAVEFEDIGGQISLLSNLGAGEGMLGNYEQAIEVYHQALSYLEQINDPTSRAHTLLNLGSAHHNLGDGEQANSFYQEGLALAQNLGDRRLQVLFLINIAMVYEDRRDYDAAIATHEQAAAIARQLEDPRIQGLIWNNLGHSLLQAGNLDQAELVLRQAIARLESIRPAQHDAYNISIFDTHVLTYNLLQQILIAQGNVEEALVISERGRARAFVERLAQQREVSSDEYPTDTAPTLDEIRRIAQTQQATLVQYSIVPDHAFKFQGRQRGADAELWIWVVQPTGDIHFQQVDLTDLDISLETLVTETRSSIGIRPRSRSQPMEFQIGDRVRRDGDPLSWLPYEILVIDHETELLTLHHPNFALPSPVHASEVYKVDSTATALPRFQLLHTILIQPIQQFLPSDSDDLVVFIPTESLFHVPFAALQDAQGHYLIEHHTTITSPSIQVLDFTSQRRQELADLSLSSATETLVVGNPDPMPNHLSRLPYAEEEAKAIAQILNTRPLIGAEATETQVRQRLETASMIHFATHGLFHENTPLQGAIAFSPDHEQDGLLTAEELLGYFLQAKLVVLSACETGQGRITGDGVLGLSRSLIQSGAPNVLVSLWQVPDDATASLMVSFYDYHQSGLSYAHALRHSMLDTLQQYPNPHQWAAFTLVGVGY